MDQVPTITSSQISGISLMPLDTNATFTFLPSNLISPILNTNYSVGIPIHNGLLTCTFKFTNVGSGFNNSLVYYGNINAPNRGDIIVQNMNGIISGMIQINQDYYVITPFQEGSGLILKINTDSDSFGKVLCGNNDSIETGGPAIIHDGPSDRCFAGSECPAEITILIVFN